MDTLSLHDALPIYVRNEGQPAIDDFIAYLSTGSQDYPVELLKIAGAEIGRAHV